MDRAIDLERATDRIYETFEDAPRHPSHVEIVAAIKDYHQSRLSELKEQVKNMKEGGLEDTNMVSRESVLNLIEQMEES